jgi:iron complex outermembrane receptor protein
MSMLRSSATVIFLSVMVGAPAVAQDLKEIVLDEIVVTATRRVQDIQSISIAVTAFDTEALRRYGIDNLRDLQALTPGFNYSSAGADARIVIRGSVNHFIQNDGDPSAGYFVDGIYASRTSQQNMPFVDIERVEVLRGPQGTLFGRNSSSGLVNVIPIRPSTEALRYGGEVGIGDYDTKHVEGYVNAPISDTTAFRFAFSKHVRDDGFIENISGPDYEDKDELLLRASLSFAPNDRFSGNIMAQYFDKDDTGASTLGYVVTGSLYDAATGTRSLFGTALPFHQRVLDGILDLDTTGDGVNDVDLGVPAAEPYKVDFDFDSVTEIESALIRGEFDFGLTDGLDLKVLASYWDHDAYRTSENDFTSILTANQAVFFTTEGKTTQLEAHLSSAQDGPVDWLVGLFYLDDDQFEDFLITALPGSGTLAFLECCTVDWEIAPGLHFYNGNIFDRVTQVDTKSWAVFGQLGWDLGEQTRLILGGRFTNDDKDYDIVNTGGVAGDTFTDSASFDAFTWKAAVEYAITDDSLLYFSASTGFRSGGFNRFAGDPPFEEEDALSFEIGSKNEFLENRLRLNLVGYYVEYDNFQEVAVSVDPITGQSLGSFVLNAGKAESYGLEIEFQAVPSERWLLAGAFSWQQSEYAEFLEGSNPFPDSSPIVDLTGNKLANSPEISATVVGSYEIPLGANGSLRPLVLVEYSDDYFTNPLNTPIDAADSYTRLDARLTYTSPNQNWQVEAYGTNLTDETVLSFTTFGGSNAAFATFQAPRMYGVIVRADF